jgi:hypothetical protein
VFESFQAGDVIYVPFAHRPILIGVDEGISYAIWQPWLSLQAFKAMDESFRSALYTQMVATAGLSVKRAKACKDFFGLTV